MLKLFYITNSPEVALIAEKNSVDRIWIDLEVLGKEERQKNMNTVKSNHTISDICKIKPLLTSSELLVRVNPWHENSENEIHAVIEAGADMVMLPMWKTVDEVQMFLQTVGGRAKTTLLLETKEAVECVDEVLKLDFDEVHIGMNDLHLSYGMKFMFELLTNGTIEMLCKKFKAKGIPYGFGGIACLGKGMIPSEKVIIEHYRLGSTRAILSRSFCDVYKCKNMNEVATIFAENMKPLRDFEIQCQKMDQKQLAANHQDVQRQVAEIVSACKE